MARPATSSRLTRPRSEPAPSFRDTATHYVLPGRQLRRHTKFRREFGQQRQPADDHSAARHHGGSCSCARLQRAALSAYQHMQRRNRCAKPADQWIADHANVQSGDTIRSLRRATRLRHGNAGQSGQFHPGAVYRWQSPLVYFRFGELGRGTTRPVAVQFVS